MHPSCFYFCCWLRRFRAAFRCGTAVLAGLFAACCLAAALPVQAAPQVLIGHVPPITKQLKAKHRLAGDAQLYLSIGLPLRNREQLTNLLEELYRPSSPNFRHF
jgi:hypothetical protein